MVELKSVTITEKLLFNLFDMPCCHHQLCWINPRLPSYCPQCGASCYIQLQRGSNSKKPERRPTMPQATEEQRAKMDEYFNNGGIMDWEPTAFLFDAGYTEKGGCWIKPSTDHVVTEKELDCLNFLRDEWDHDYDFTQKET